MWTLSTKFSVAKPSKTLRRVLWTLSTRHFSVAKPSKYPEEGILWTLPTKFSVAKTGLVNLHFSVAPFLCGKDLFFILNFRPMLRTVAEDRSKRRWTTSQLKPDARPRQPPGNLDQVLTQAKHDQNFHHKAEPCTARHYGIIFNLSSSFGQPLPDPWQPLVNPDHALALVQT